jgi:predicted DNA-binding protein
VAQQSSSLLVTIPEKDKKIIRLHPDVHKELGELVEHKGETYNDIVKRLIRHYKETAKKSHD